jgi:hypothetical protein
MPTPQKSTTTASILDSMETVTDVTALPRRGRQVSGDTIAIRAELVKQLSAKTPAVRAFVNVTDAKMAESLARRVRAAGKYIKGDDLGEIQITTRFDAQGQKLVWGPSEVFKSLKG